MPLLRCSFVSEMFADLFIPFCVDAFGTRSTAHSKLPTLHPSRPPCLCACSACSAWWLCARRERILLMYLIVYSRDAASREVPRR